MCLSRSTRLCCGRRSPFSFSDVALAALLVFLGRESFQFDQPALNGSIEYLPEKGDAPAATSAGATALGNLAWHARLGQANEILDLPP